MPRLNWTIISSNVREAREQLQEIEALCEEGKRPREGQLQVLLEHAYHHLNVAWNARSASTRAYRTLTDEQFDEWGRFPDDVVLPATSCSRDASGEATS